MTIHIFCKNIPPSWEAFKTLKKIIKICQNFKLLPRKTVVVSLSAVNAQKMTRLNFKYRAKRKPTDVLSFEQAIASAPKNVFFLGDLVLCKDIVPKQAKAMGHSVKKEVTILLVHGVLHLLGFDHEYSHKKASQMALQESKILSLFYQRRATGLIHRT